MNVAYCKYMHPCEIIDLENNVENETCINFENNLIFVKGYINDKILNILIDTASEGTLINSNFVNLNVNAKNIIKIPKITILGANNKKICEVNKNFFADIQIGKQIYRISTLVVDNLTVDMILGADELCRFATRIDYDSSKIKLGNQEIEFQLGATDHKGNFTKEILQEISCSKINMHNKEQQIMLINLKNTPINCEPKHLEFIEQLLRQHIGLISEENRVARDYIHKIEVRDIENFQSKSYPIPYQYRKQVNREIQDMIDNKIIERADTMYINPIVVVRKSSGELRLCLDARNINSCTVPQYETPMSIDSILGRITNASIFSKIDLKHSFWLISLDENCRKYTGFRINGVVYQFRVVPFGLQSACSALVRAMHKLLDKYEDFTLHYIDDILIYSKNIDEHKEHVKIILKVLDKAGLKINVNKCNFFKEQTKFLGFQIQTAKISMDPERIQVINEYPRPINLKTLRGFLGMVRYFQRLIPDLSQLEIPLVELLKKNCRWKWDKKQENAFQNIKQVFSNNLQIYHPNFAAEFILRTDASAQRFSGVLLQVINEIEYPIYFCSRMTKLFEKNYSVSELELASIIFCVQKLRFYLLGKKFTIETDHSALISILNNKYGNSRVHRWSLLLQEYDFNIKYIKGKNNVVADCLTRNNEKEKTKRIIKVGLNIMTHEQGLFSLERIREDQVGINAEIVSTNLEKNGIFYRIINGQELYIVSQSLTKEILLKLHSDFGHMGSRKLWLMFRENYYNKNDLSLSKKITTTCKTCQIAKDKNYRNYNVTKSVIANKKLQLIAMDFISNLPKTNNGNQHMLVIVDIFSKFIKLYPCKKTNVNELKRNINKFCDIIGKPDACIIDNATYFQNERFKNYCNNKNITINFTSIRNPQSNPAERYIKEIIKFLRIVCHDSHDLWDNHIESIEKYMNCTHNLTTLEPPERVMTQHTTNRPWKLINQENYNDIINRVNKNLQNRANKYTRRLNKRTRFKKTFQENELVIIRALRQGNYRTGECAKLQYPFEGPYKVSTVQGVNSYQLVDPITNKIRGIFNIKDIYEYKS